MIKLTLSFPSVGAKRSASSSATGKGGIVITCLGIQYGNNVLRVEVARYKVNQLYT